MKTVYNQEEFTKAINEAKNGEAIIFFDEASIHETKSEDELHNEARELFKSLKKRHNQFGE